MVRFTSKVCAAIALLALVSPLATQVPTARAADPAQTIKRIPLQRFEVPGTTYETVIGIAEIAPNVNAGRHTHPGPESGYAIEGSFELLIDGQPPRLISAGESYMVPANVVHDARTGSEAAKVIATYLIPDGKPVATPAD